MKITNHTSNVRMINFSKTASLWNSICEHNLWVESQAASYLHKHVGKANVGYSVTACTFSLEMTDVADSFQRHQCEVWIWWRPGCILSNDCTRPNPTQHVCIFSCNPQIPAVVPHLDFMFFLQDCWTFITTWPLGEPLHRHWRMTIVHLLGHCDLIYVLLRSEYVTHPGWHTLAHT